MVMQCRVVMQKTDHHSEQASFYRFWKNDKVTESGLTELCINHCVEQIQGVEHVLLVEDTTELNLEQHRGRIKDTENLGVQAIIKIWGVFAIRPLRLMP